MSTVVAKDIWDLRKDKGQPATTSKPSESKLAGMISSLALQPGGTIQIDPNSLSGADKRMLAAMHLENATEVPQRISDVVAAIRESASSPVGAPVPEDTPPAEFVTKQLEDLEPAERDHVQRKIAELLEKSKDVQTFRDSIPVGLKPDAARSIAVSSGRNPDTFLPINEPAPSKPADAGPLPPGPQPAPSPPPLEPDIELSPPEAGLGVPAHLCPHCGLNPKVTGAYKATPEDMRNFIGAMGSGRRFHKEFELYGGALKVTFRSLSYQETVAVNAQVTFDWKRGVIPTEAERLERKEYYRYALAIERIQFADTDILVPELFDPKIVHPAEGPAVDAFCERLFDTVLGNSSLKSVIFTTFIEFVGLVNSMEIRKFDPNFMKEMQPPV